MKIFVAGANGYIGLAVCIAARRNGYIVYGLIRNEKYKKLLQINEIIPVLGNIEEPETYSKYIDEVNVIVDTVQTNSFDKSNRKFIETIISLNKKNQTKNYLKKYIYTSGILVYGDNPNKILDENFVPSPSQLLNWRVELEQFIISNNKIHGVVIRSGFVYGGRNKFLNYLWSSGKPILYGKKDKVWSWIHIEDLANLFIRIIESPSAIVSGQIFNAVDDSSRYTFEEIIKRIFDVTGTKETIQFESIDNTNNNFLKICDISVFATSKKAKNILGWSPKISFFLDDILLYYHSFLSNF